MERVAEAQAVLAEGDDVEVLAAEHAEELLLETAVRTLVQVGERRGDARLEAHVAEVLVEHEVEVLVHGERHHHAQRVERRRLHLVGCREAERVAVEQCGASRAVLVLGDEHHGRVDHHRHTVVLARMAQQSARGESLSQVGSHGDARIQGVRLAVVAAVGRVGLQRHHRVVYRDDKFHVFILICLHKVTEKVWVMRKKQRSNAVL